MILITASSTLLYAVYYHQLLSYYMGGGRVVRWCWVNFMCRDVLQIWITGGQGPTALAVGAVGIVW